MLCDRQSKRKKRLQLSEGWLDSKSVIHSRGCTAAPEGAAVVVMPLESEHRQAESACTAFLYHPAGFFPALDLQLRCRTPRGKTERRRWLRFSTYGSLEMSLLIGIIRDWIKPDTSMNSRGNRLWRVRPSLVVRWISQNETTKARGRYAKLLFILPDQWQCH